MPGSAWRIACAPPESVRDPLDDPNARRPSRRRCRGQVERAPALEQHLVAGLEVQRVHLRDRAERGAGEVPAAPSSPAGDT
jgi:hypothetical protein